MIRSCVSNRRAICTARTSRTICARSKKPEVEAEPEPEQEGRGNNKLTVGSLIELIGFGLGAPVPSAIEFDKEKKVVRMDFEANNFDQQYAYFEEGYVDEDADVMKKIGNFFKFGKKKDEDQ